MKSLQSLSLEGVRLRKKLTRENRRYLSRVVQFVKQHPDVTLLDYIKYRQVLGDPVTDHELRALIGLIPRSTVIQVLSKDHRGSYHSTLRSCI